MVSKYFVNEILINYKGKKENSRAEKTRKKKKNSQEF